MSILIKGMEMPSICGHCFLRRGECKERIYMPNRPSNCPLIPVPPHGRLIDADEFYKDINESILLTDGFKDAFNLWFDEQPTIIEAELPIHHGTFAAASKKEALERIIPAEEGE